MRNTLRFIASLLALLLAISACSPPASPVVEQTTVTLIDTLSVPANGKSVVAKVNLESGVVYTLLASGTCFVGPQGRNADVEYAFDTNSDQVKDKCDDTPSGTEFGIALNDVAAENGKFIVPGWGHYTPQHTYRIAIVGKGRPISVRYSDCILDDNEGSLTLEIYRHTSP